MSHMATTVIVTIAVLLLLVGLFHRSALLAYPCGIAGFVLLAWVCR